MELLRLNLSHPNALCTKSVDKVVNGSMSPPDRQRVYLDHAATSWPKSATVLDAVMGYLQTCGATSGRGTYASGQVADRWLGDARRHVAKLIHAPAASDVAICSSGTHALNAALHGVLKPGDEVVTTASEHNSVLRPLQRMKAECGIRLRIVATDATGVADLNQAKDFVSQSTKLVALGHASNVTGAIQDLDGWGRLAKQAEAIFLVDASQTLGYLPIDVQTHGIDLLATAGHKGLGAISGTGILYVNSNLQSGFRPLMSGGTGLRSESLDGGTEWPFAVEVGNLNMPGVVSLAVAAKERLAAEQLYKEPAEQPSKQPAEQSQRAVFNRLVEGLRGFDAVRLIGYLDETAPVERLTLHRVPLVSVLVEGWDIHDFAAVLDSSFGIEVRAGWHCAALAHDAASLTGAVETGRALDNYSGTLRLSTGHTTTMEQVDYTISAFREILS